MLSCTTLEAMKIWGELVKCYYGLNTYDNNIAEIYSYRLEPYNPTAHLNQDNANTYIFERLKEISKNSLSSLLEIVESFCETFECKAEINNETIQSWKKRLNNKDIHFNLRYHVSIVKK